MLSSRKGRGTCERERAASELVQVGLVGDPGVLPLGLHLWVRRHAELDAWVGNEVSTRLHGLDGFEQLTYLLAHLDEEARDHAVQQHVGEEAAAHLGGHSQAGPYARGWFAHPVRTRWRPRGARVSMALSPPTSGARAVAPRALPARSRPRRTCEWAKFIQREDVQATHTTGDRHPGRAADTACPRA